jgi:bla regulator protein BlaR1
VRSLRVHEVDAQLQDRLHALSERLGISKKIRLLQSGLVKVPVTIGHFKPVILKINVLAPWKKSYCSRECY